MTRLTLWLMIPSVLFFPAWVWIGRVVFGVGGWFIFILLPVAAVALVCLLITTILALTRRGSPKSLTAAQTFLQWSVWTALFTWGLFMPDFGDTEDSKTSILTQVFGYSDNLYDVSFTVSFIAASASALLWVALLFSLIANRGSEARAAQ